MNWKKLKIYKKFCYINNNLFFFKSVKLATLNIILDFLFYIVENKPHYWIYDSVCLTHDYIISTIQKNNIIFYQNSIPNRQIESLRYCQLCAEAIYTGEIHINTYLLPNERFRAYCKFTRTVYCINQCFTCCLEEIQICHDIIMHPLTSYEQKYEAYQKAQNCLNLLKNVYHKTDLLGAQLIDPNSNRILTRSRDNLMNCVNGPIVSELINLAREAKNL